MNDQRNSGPARPRTIGAGTPAIAWLAGLGLLLGTAGAQAGQHYPEPTPPVVTAPSGLTVPTVPSGVVVQAPHAPKLVKAPAKPSLSASAQRRLAPDGLGIRLHDPRLRETIREVAEERAAHDGAVERHNQAAQQGIRQTLIDADAMNAARAAAVARDREAHEGFWYRLFHAH